MTFDSSFGARKVSESFALVWPNMSLQLSPGCERWGQNSETDGTPPPVHSRPPVLRGRGEDGGGELPVPVQRGGRPVRPSLCQPEHWRRLSDIQLREGSIKFSSVTKWTSPWLGEEGSNWMVSKHWILYQKCIKWIEIDLKMNEYNGPFQQWEAPWWSGERTAVL